MVKMELMVQMVLTVYLEALMVWMEVMDIVEEMVDLEVMVLMVEMEQMGISRCFFDKKLTISVVVLVESKSNFLTF